MKYLVKSHLIHNNTSFPPGSIIELTPDEASIDELIGGDVITPAKEADIAREDKPETKPIEKFHAPSSTPEIEKAVREADMAPEKRGKCPKCKAEREIKNAQVSRTKKGQVSIIGECAVCGIKMHRFYGKIAV